MNQLHLNIRNQVSFTHMLSFDACRLQTLTTLCIHHLTTIETHEFLNFVNIVGYFQNSVKCR